MIPLKVTTRNGHSSKRVEEEIRRKLERLESIHPRIMRCEVALEGPNGRAHDVVARVDLVMPGAELVAHSRAAQKLAALRDAFHAIRRQMEAVIERRRG